MAFLRMLVYLIGIGFLSLCSASLSYYKMEPCSKYLTFDYPVALFPWEEKNSSVMSVNCHSSVNQIENLIKMGRSFSIGSMEAAVAKTLSDYSNFQKAIAKTLLCCTKLSDSPSSQNISLNCNAPQVKTFCDGSGGQNSFSDYLEDLNQRLQAVRIAAYRMNPKNKSFANAKLKGIEPDIPFLLSAIGSITGDSLISLARYPQHLQPLTQEELDLAETHLHPNKLESRETPTSKFRYGKFITKQPSEDYYTLIEATPFLAEVSTERITPDALGAYLTQYLEHNPENEISFGHFFYKDFMGLISEKIKLAGEGDSQRDLCRYAESRLKLAYAEIVMLKEIPLAIALAYSTIKGGRSNSPKTSPLETMKKISQSLGMTAPAAITASDSINLMRTSRIDKYCSMKFSDENLSQSAPLCKQYEILKTLGDIQSSMIMSAAVTGGFLTFRYGAAEIKALRQINKTEP